jgi:hypothetical protein
MRAFGGQRDALLEYFVQNSQPGVIRLDGDTASGRAYLTEIIRLRNGSSHLKVPRHHAAGGLAAHSGCTLASYVCGQFAHFSEAAEQLAERLGVGAQCRPALAGQSNGGEGHRAVPGFLAPDVIGFFELA